MGKIFALDSFHQERTIRSQFLFRLSGPMPGEKGYDYVVLLDRDGTIIKEKPESTGKHYPNCKCASCPIAKRQTAW